MKRLFLFLCLFGLAACAGQPQNVAELPTQFVAPTLLPSDTPRPSDSPQPVVEPVVTDDISTPSPTNTAIAGVPPTQTVTPSLTITDTITRTPSPTVTEPYEPNFLDEMMETAAHFTVVPTGLVGISTPGQPVITSVFPTLPAGNGTGTCQYLPPAGFGVIYGSDPSIPVQLGCPVGAPPTVTPQISAYQPFERGMMVWVSTPFKHIYVLYNDGTYQRYDDLYDPNVDPESGSEVPPPNLVEPMRGFGKIWRNAPQVRDKLGWATQIEQGGSANVLGFERGSMINNLSRGGTLVLSQQGGPIGGLWKSVTGGY